MICRELPKRGRISHDSLRLRIQTLMASVLVYALLIHFFYVTDMTHYSEYRLKQTKDDYFSCKTGQKTAYRNLTSWIWSIDRIHDHVDFPVNLLFLSRRFHPPVLLPQHVRLDQLGLLLQLVRELRHMIGQKVNFFISLKDFFVKKRTQNRAKKWPHVRRNKVMYVTLQPLFL